MNDKGNRVFAVLGMHRSGTSAIMRSLNLLGVYLGEEKELVPPYPENPEGFWERLDVINIHQRLLAGFNRSWDTAAPLPEAWQYAPKVQPFRAELSALIRRNFFGLPLWGWKDPRSMILFDLWKEVLDELGVELSVIFAVRNPLDVARSLNKRNGFPLDKGYGIWLNYNLAALRAIVPLPTFFISYDKFLADWETELHRCACDLDIPWPQNDSRLRSSMKLFIRPDLRHSFTTAEDLQKASAPRPVLELYVLLQRLLDSDVAIETVTKAVEELYGDFCEYSRFYQHDLDVAWDTKMQLAAEKANLEEYDHRIQEQLKPEASGLSKLLRKLRGV